MITSGENNDVIHVIAEVIEDISPLLDRLLDPDLPTPTPPPDTALSSATQNR